MKPSRVQIIEVRKYTGSFAPLDIQERVKTRELAARAKVPGPVVRAVLPGLGYVHIGRGVWELHNHPPRWRRLWWWMHDYQPATWFGHAATTALVPLLAVLALPWASVNHVAVACYVAGYYGIREINDFSAKVKAGILHKADRQGVTGFVDGIIDWGGPVAVAVTYALAHLIQTLR